MKKFLIILLSMVMIFSMTACNLDEGKTPVNSGTNSVSQKSTFPNKAITILVPWSAGGVLI